MFQGKRFVTKGVMDSVPVAVQAFLWGLIDKLASEKVVELDYLQVFELGQAANGGQRIVHCQELPEEYWSAYIFENVENPITVKVYVIDDGPYCTMCLPEER